MFILRFTVTLYRHVYVGDIVFHNVPSLVSFFRFRGWAIIFIGFVWGGNYQNMAITYPNILIVMLVYA